ncbi:MAG TPA: aminopeptidase N [Rhodanobacteraceae bacterium]|nr:aminopeptidase N [Rhodanobacteraceae bacterium]
MSDTTIHRSDYRPPAWRVPQVELEFDLDIDHSEVQARLHLACDDGEETPLQLDGESLELLEIALDGRPLGPLEYRLHDATLEVPGARNGSVLSTRVRVQPAANSALQGLYLSGSRDDGFLLTQCEAEGFRRITFFPDRPDVLSRYRVTLRADATRFPVLLAGGNADGHGALPDGRHYACFVDPWPKSSYLFALVAGRLESIRQDYTTADGRAVEVRLWAEPWAITRCQHAMDSVLAAMRWDETHYGRNYDLAQFHVVATGDFNMGAMENKGLNIFNSKYLLADPDASTDEDYAHVEAVVGHEYFHNWSGNRVTCRDWFQLSLKEGFTVFREQSFAADMNDPTLQRIADVTRLRQQQFAEDAGPLAHPVRPDSYREIDNFYTATVYEKGAELVRMLAGHLGDAGFRRGCELYFTRHDGEAVTIEHFLAALGDANSADLSPFLAWYGQAGTPQLHVESVYEATEQRYRLHLSQTTAPGPHAAHKPPLPIPVALRLLAPDGSPLPLRLHGEHAAQGTDRVLLLTDTTAEFRFEDIAARPVASVLRGFSAPVALHEDSTAADLALLMVHESSGFDRWQAGQRLARRAFDELCGGDRRIANTAWLEATAACYADPRWTDEPALLAEFLKPPAELELAQSLSNWNPVAVRTAREDLLMRLAETLGAKSLRARHALLQSDERGAQNGTARARRRLKNQLLALLLHVDREHALALAQAQCTDAPGMTDRLAALRLLVHQQADAAAAALLAFQQRHAGDALALDKGLAVAATIPGEPALARVQALLAGPHFLPHNPNRVYAVLGAFAQANPTGFHRADGAGYALLAEQLLQQDRINPTTAARLANAFAGWTRLEPVRREHLKDALLGLSQESGVSRALAEMLARLVGPA